MYALPFLAVLPWEAKDISSVNSNYNSNPKDKKNSFKYVVLYKQSSHTAAEKVWQQQIQTEVQTLG